MKSNEYVIILHGIARSSAHMQPLANFLTKQGYSVININYPSTQYNIDYLAHLINKEIAEHIEDQNNITHFVGYSMGALLVRAIIATYRPLHLGRVVLIAPPNHGSEVADYLKHNMLYRTFFGPAGQELTTQHRAMRNLLEPVDYELGIIAGSFSIDPISSLMIPGTNDGKVSVESTKLEGMRDHVVISASHTFFPSNKLAHKQVLAFLKQGKFNVI